MKKLISTLAFVAFLFVAHNANSQACGTSIPCIPLGGPPSGGFGSQDSTPCVVQGAAYSYAIQFTMFAAFEFAGSQTVDSIEFLSIDNLPCGLCWSVDQDDKRYSANEDGCLNITGTSNDTVGQYKLAVSLKAWINGQPGGQTIPANVFDQTGVKILVRVKSPSGACVPADTSAAADLTNVYANPVNCTNVGIKETANSFSGLTLIPNPMNSNGTLSFMAEKSGLFTVRVSNTIGSVVSSKEIDAKQGVNTVTIERNSLPNGVYFLSLTDGKNVITHRFSITE